MPAILRRICRPGRLSAIVATVAVVLAPAAAHAAAAGGFTAPDDPGVAGLIAGLRGCVNSLPAADRQVLTLRAGLGASPAQLTAQVAAALGEPVATVTRAEVVGIRRLEAARRRGLCQAQPVSAAPKPAPTKAKAAATTTPAATSASDSTTGVLDVVVPAILVLAFTAGISLEVNRRPGR